MQEPERSGNGIGNVRYRARWKAMRVRRLLEVVEQRTPWLTVRDAF